MPNFIVQDVKNCRVLRNARIATEDLPGICWSAYLTEMSQGPALTGVYSTSHVPSWLSLQVILASTGPSMDRPRLLCPAPRLSTVNGFGWLVKPCSRPVQRILSRIVQSITIYNTKCTRNHILRKKARYFITSNIFWRIPVFEQNMPLFLSSVYFIYWSVHLRKRKCALQQNWVFLQAYQPLRVHNVEMVPSNRMQTCIPLHRVSQPSKVLVRHIFLVKLSNVQAEK